MNSALTASAAPTGAAFVKVTMAMSADGRNITFVPAPRQNAPECEY